MKKLLILTIILLTLVPIVYAAGSPSITATLISQDPDPVEPGQVVTVKFKVENDGSATNQDVVVTLNPKNPFTLYSGTETQNIGKLKGGSTGTDAVIVEYKIKVSEDAVEKETELELKLATGKTSISYINDEFLIDIQTHDAILEVTSISLDPEQIAPGETADLKITVKNLADSLLKDIKFTLDFESADLPLAPFQSSSQRRIAQLETNRYMPLNFKIIADPDATPGLYKVPLNITYNDEQGNRYLFSDVVAVSIGESPKLRTYVKKSTVRSKRAAGVVTIGIANAGTTDVKFLEMTVLPSDDFSLVSTSDYIYVGDVDSDDTESDEITIYVTSREDQILIPVQLKYYDANNLPYEQTVELPLNLYSGSELKKFGIVENGSSGIWIILILLGIGGYFAYKKWWKKKKRT